MIKPSNFQIAKSQILFLTLANNRSKSNQQIRETHFESKKGLEKPKPSAEPLPPPPKKRRETKERNYRNNRNADRCSAPWTKPCRGGAADITRIERSIGKNFQTIVYTASRCSGRGGRTTGNNEGLSTRSQDAYASKRAAERKALNDSTYLGAGAAAYSNDVIGNKRASERASKKKRSRIRLDRQKQTGYRPTWNSLSRPAGQLTVIISRFLRVNRGWPMCQAHRRSLGTATVSPIGETIDLARESFEGSFGRRCKWDRNAVNFIPIFENIFCSMMFVWGSQNGSIFPLQEMFEDV